MKKMLSCAFSLLMSGCMLVSTSIIPTSAEGIKEMEAPLNSLEMQNAEKFIEAGNREGLYTYLYSLGKFTFDQRFLNWTRNGDIFTGTYILDNDEYYENVLNHYVYPHEKESSCPLSDEEIAQAEAFIESGDRAGLYEFLTNLRRFKEDWRFDKWTISWEHDNYGEYVLDNDEYYENVLYYFVYPHEKEMEYPLTDEEIAQAEVFIEANDRLGLYDFITDKHTQDNGMITDGMLMWFLTGYVGDEYNTDDKTYDLILNQYVYPHETKYQDPITTASPVKGDANMDNRISISDIIMVNKINTRAVEVQNYDQAQAADVDGSYMIDSEDVYMMMQYVVNLIDSFPET